MNNNVGQAIATGLLIAVLIFLGFAVYKMYNDPKYKGQEPGKVLIYLANKYLVTWLILLQTSALIAEAAMIGAAQDERTNVASRMALHLVIAAGSIIAAFLWVQSIYEFVKVLISKKSLGEKFALGLICFLIACITILLASAAPFYNMWALANAMDNTTQLELFANYVQYKFGFMSQYAYYGSIREALPGYNPAKYAAFANLHSALVSSVGITVYHIFFTMWEMLFVLKLSVTQKSMSDILGFDLIEFLTPDPTTATAAAGAGAGGTATAPTPPNPRAASQVQIDAVLKYCGIADDKIEDWSKKVLALYSRQPAAEHPRMTLLWGKYFLGVKKLESGANKTAEGETPAELIAKIRATLKTWSNNALTLPKSPLEP